ncbi:MAG: ferrous iron transport protein A [Clostridia bacterium]|nr:ferrous iron transport protein A [Clostridia bacterium]
MRTKEQNMALAFAPFGKELKIVKITADEKTRRHLENLGLLVGADVISMYDISGDVIIKVRDCKLALNRSLAMKIQVA